MTSGKVVQIQAGELPCQLTAEPGVPLIDEALRIAAPPSDRNHQFGVELGGKSAQSTHGHAIDPTALDQRDNVLGDRRRATNVGLPQTQAMAQRAQGPADLSVVHAVIVSRLCNAAYLPRLDRGVWHDGDVARKESSAVASATWSQVAALRLARQHLIDRLPAGRLLEVVREHVGIQAQVMSLAELQLNARLDGLRRDDVRDALWSKRSLVKTWAMRGTLHLFASDDLANFVAAAPTRGQWGGPAWLKYFDVTADELETVFRTVEDTLTAEPMTRAEIVDAVSKATGRPELGAKLQSGWGSFLKPASHAGALVFGPDRGRNVTFVDPEEWLGRKVRRKPGAQTPERALAKLVERFLRLFPGADQSGVGRWWGARATMRPVLKGLDVATIDVERARCLALADDAAALVATKPFQGVRLLPGFDAYVNDLPRRIDALLPVDRHDAVHRVAGWVSPVVVVDGRVAGTWELSNGKQGGIEVTPFGRWRSGARKELALEADRIAAFLDRPLRVQVGQRRHGS